MEQNHKVHFAEGSPMTEQAASGFGDQSNEESLLSIDSEVIAFNKEGNDITGSITLKNITTDKCLCYKIKTTSPEKFRVRPSTGTLMPAQQGSVSVMLLPGYTLHGLLRNDKFQVMCLPVRDEKMTQQELNDLWKTSGKNAEQHRLRCAGAVTENGDTTKLTSSSSVSITSGDRSIGKLISKITHLEDCYNKLHEDLTFSRRLQLISIALTVFMAIAIVYILRSDIRNSTGQAALSNVCSVVND